MEKSANKQWRESGTTLSFKEWISRENQKKEQTTLSFIGEEQVRDVVNQTYTNVNSAPAPRNTSTVFGLNKTVLVVSSVLIFGSLGYYFYRRLKTRQ